jgi:aminoglycoside phosphotransferase (APT) family kinase protein
VKPLWTAEQIVTEEIACQLIEEQFPELKPVYVKVLGEGFDNTVYNVNDSFVFRFPRRAVAVKLLETENHLLPELVPILPIQIPEPIYFGMPTAEYAWPFTGYRIVHGETVNCLTNDQRLQSAKPLANFLRTLHRFPVQKARELGVQGDELNRLDLALRIPRLKQNLSKAIELGIYEDSEAIVKFLLSLPSKSYYVEPTLVHGDLHVRNLLVDSNGSVSGIIDWGDTHIGDPAIDLSIVYSFLPPEGRDLFYQHYGNVHLQTKQMARFKAIYTALLLLLYGHDREDCQLLTVAKDSLDLALRD